MKRSYFGGFVIPRMLQIKDAPSIIASELISGNFPIIILVAGGSASGKTTFANKLVERLQKLSFDVILISMDDYYIGKEYSEKYGYNFDQPESIDILMLKRHLDDLKKENPLIANL
jgi:uridine kinase